MIDCRDCRQQLEEAALVGPDVAVSKQMEEHLFSCGSCRDELRDLREAWAFVPTALETNQPSAALESAVMDRIAGTPNAAPVRVEQPPSRRVEFWRYALAASVLAALITAAVIARRGWNVSGSDDVEQIKDIAQQLDKLDQLERIFANPVLHYASLQPIGAGSRVQGYLVHDPAANQAHFLGSELPRKPNEVYKIWLLGPNDEVVCSAAFEASAERIGGVVIDLPADASTIREAVVTSETDPDVQSPSSDVRMRASIDF